MQTTSPTHDEQTDSQFGPQARAYLNSAVHAHGPDLIDMAQRLRGRINARALDIGCGAGHLAFAIAPEVSHVVACDLSAEMLRITAAEAAERGLTNLTVRQAPAEALPFEDAQFDVVCTRFSAHHWRDLPAALREARRVVKPDGRLYVIDVIGHDDPLLDTHLQAIELLRDPSHLRNRTLGEWRAALGESGFTLQSHRCWPLRMEFASWIARMRTPADRAAVIRSLLLEASDEVKAGMNIGPDGSFDLCVAFVDSAPSEPVQDTSAVVAER